MSRIFGLRLSNYNFPTTADQITTVHIQVYYNDPNTAKQLLLHYNYWLAVRKLSTSKTTYWKQLIGIYWLIISGRSVYCVCLMP